jgi:protection-of-telomeres protein 1
MQLTAWEEHSEFFRGHVKVGDWVLLQNVHVVPGKMESYLEGNLRHDRGAFGGRGPQITVFSYDEDPEQADVRWKEAVRRKREWKKRHEAQMRDYLDDIEEDKTGKRKRDVQGKSQNNGKRRKREKLAAAEKNAKESDQKKADKLGLNVSSVYSQTGQTDFGKVLILYSQSQQRESAVYPSC